MRNFICFILLISLSKNAVFAQVDSLKTSSLEIEFFVHDKSKVKSELETFFLQNKIVPDLLNETNYQFTSLFVLKENSYLSFLDLSKNWGAINFKKVESINYTEKLNMVTIEIDRLLVEKEEYTNLLNQVDVKSENHVKYWEKLEDIKVNLRKQIKLKEEFEGSNKKFKVKLTVKEENILTNEPNFSFVNMPGIQYSYFVPSGDLNGFYPSNMTGYSIKYLMNRRKTYLEIGLFKSNQSNEDLNFDELYKFGIGQDFYSSHLGRGTRQFLNLYSGFNLGAFILTGGNEKNMISWYCSPSIGLELYKNKYLLLDSKAGYFLPFKENRNLRGFLVELSFNVVF